MAWKDETSSRGSGEKARREAAEGEAPKESAGPAGMAPKESAGPAGTALQEPAGSAGEAPQKLPDLTGTEKQVAWATTLRAAAVKEIREILQKMWEAEAGAPKPLQHTARELQQAAAYGYELHTDARFWIENRLEPRKNLMFWFLKEYKEQAIAQMPEDVKAELLEERERLTVRPARAAKSGVVELAYKKGVLTARYVKDETFREIVKSKKFHWEGTCWKRAITQYTGSAQNRAAELGNALLAAGFTVSFFDEASKEKAVRGTYKPEQERWIAWDEELQKLTLIWNGKNDLLYGVSRKLPGARLEKGKIRVAVEFYREVLDFADRMGFSISKEARGQIDQRVQKEKRFEVRKVRRPQRKDIGDKERLKKTLVASGAIIEDLKDDIE